MSRPPEHERLQTEIVRLRAELQFYEGTEKGRLRVTNAKLLAALKRARCHARAISRALREWPGIDPHRPLKEVPVTFGRLVDIKAHVQGLDDLISHADGAIKEAEE